MKTKNYKDIVLPMRAGDICIEYQQAKRKDEQIQILADQNKTTCAVIAWIVLLGGEKPCNYWLRSITGDKAQSAADLRASEAGRQASSYRDWAHPEITDADMDRRISKAIADAEKRACMKKRAALRLEREDWEETEPITEEEPIATMKVENTMGECNNEQINTTELQKAIILDANEADAIRLFFDKALLSYIKNECDSLTEVSELTAVYKKILDWRGTEQ